MSLVHVNKCNKMHYLTIYQPKEGNEVGKTGKTVIIDRKFKRKEKELKVFQNQENLTLGDIYIYRRFEVAPKPLVILYFVQHFMGHQS